MERLDGPAVFDEAAREPVEKVRMCGLVAANAKVAWSANDRVGEVVFPDSVDDDPGGQGVFLRCDRFGEFESAAAVGVAP